LLIFDPQRFVIEIRKYLFLIILKLVSVNLGTIKILLKQFNHILSVFK